MHISGFIISSTNLATNNLHESIAHYQAVLAATINRSHDKCIATDFQMRFFYHGKQVGQGISERVGFATAAAKHIAQVVLVSSCSRFRHDGLVSAHLSSPNQHLGLARTCRAGLGLSHDMASRCCCLGVKLSEGTYRANFATTIKAAFNDSSIHDNRGIACYKTRLLVGKSAFTSTVDGAFDDYLCRSQAAREQHGQQKESFSS